MSLASFFWIMALEPKEKRKIFAMNDLQTAKKLVRSFYADLEAAGPDDCVGVLSQYCNHDLKWRGYHPFHELAGAEVVAEQFWQPLFQSLFRIQRRMDLFFAGFNYLDDQKTLWVASMGHLMGLFDAPWLGLKPTRKIAMLRYAEFHRLEIAR